MTNMTDPTTNGRSSKKGIGIGLAAGLLGGTAAGLVLGVPGLSGAAADTGAVAGPAAIVQQVDYAVFVQVRTDELAGIATCVRAGETEASGEGREVHEMDVPAAAVHVAAGARATGRRRCSHHPEPAGE